MDAALRAASILKSDVFVLYLFDFLHVAQLFICLDLSLGNIIEVLVLKNAAECISQRLKWTSGARVMFIVHAWLAVSR